MSGDTDPRQIDDGRNRGSGPLAEPISPSLPVGPEMWGEVCAAAMTVAEFPYLTNGDFSEAAYALAREILRCFPDDGGAVEEATMHNVGRVLVHLCGATVLVDRD